MLLSSLLAACDPDSPIGCITPPDYIKPGIDGGKLTGIMVLLNSILKLVFILAGLWAFFNFILAGFQFISAGGDPKTVGKAWARIWQSFVGILIIVASFLFAAIIGLLFFKDPTAILKPTLSIETSP